MRTIFLLHVVIAVMMLVKGVELGGTAEACERSGIPVSIDCGEKEISITHAAYGVNSNDNTCGSFYGGDCIAETSLQVMQERCDGKNSCAVEARNSIFGDPCFQVRKYLTVTWECTIPGGTVEACERSGLSIDCGGKQINITHAAYGIYSNDNNCRPRPYTGDCIAETSLQVMQERCDGENSCAVDATNRVFGDPCRWFRKYLTVTYDCVTTGGTAEACEWSGIPVSIDCGQKEINITHAAYGIYSNDNTCRWSPYEGDCIAETSLQMMQERCDGEHYCDVEASNRIFGDPCVNVRKYLTATWECISLGTD